MQQQNDMHQPNLQQQTSQNENEIPIIRAPSLNPQYSVPVRVPVQVPVSRVPAPAPLPAAPKQLNTLEFVIRPEETEAEKAEKTNDAFEKMLQFMTIMGQVDAYISEKAQSAIKTIAKIAEDNKEDERRF